jgi:hypothetical protein
VAVEGVVAGVDRPHRTGETAFKQVAKHHGTNATGALGGADDGDGARLKQGLQVADAQGDLRQIGPL